MIEKQPPRFPAFQELIGNKCSNFQRHIQNGASRLSEFSSLTARHGSGLLQAKRNTHRTLSSGFTDADVYITGNANRCLICQSFFSTTLTGIRLNESSGLKTFEWVGARCSVVGRANSGSTVGLLLLAF